MAQFTVNASKLKETANQLNTLASQFKSGVEELRSQENILNNQWEGEANDTFHKSFQSDARQFDEFYNGILNYIKALEQAAEEYERVENTNRNIAQNAVQG